MQKNSKRSNYRDTRSLSPQSEHPQGTAAAGGQPRPFLSEYIGRGIQRDISEQGKTRTEKQQLGEDWPHSTHCCKETADFLQSASQESTLKETLCARAQQLHPSARGFA